MENHTNRPLAYLLAKTIPDHELEAIVGGHHVGLSAHQTMRITGDSAQGPVMHYDVNFDM